MCWGVTTSTVSPVHAGVSLGWSLSYCVHIAYRRRNRGAVSPTLATVCGSTVSLVHAGVSLGRSLCVDISTVSLVHAGVSLG